MPRDQAEANVCRLAGMIVDGRYPEAGKRLSDAAATYFADHPEQQVPSAEVVRRGWSACWAGKLGETEDKE